MGVPKPPPLMGLLWVEEVEKSSEEEEKEGGSDLERWSFLEDRKRRLGLSLRVLGLMLMNFIGTMVVVVEERVGNEDEEDDEE